MFVYRAFWDLTSDRHTAAGEGVIPFVAIRHYVHELDLGFDAIEWLRLIREMDKAYLQFREEKKEAEDAWNKRPAKREGLHRQHR